MMSLSFIRFCSRHTIFYAAVIVMVLVVGAVARSMANESANFEGPAFTMPTDEATPSDEATQPDIAAQAENSAQSEKSAEPEEEPEAAELELRTKATEPESKTDVVAPEEDKSATSLPSPAGRGAGGEGEGANESSSSGAKHPHPNPLPKGEGTIGEPLAPGMIKLLQDEVLGAFKRRGINDRIARFQRYMTGRVSATAGKYTGSELTGNCRIRWYDQMMRNVMAAPAEAERFTRKLHTAAVDDREGLARVLAIASVKMDAGRRKPQKYPSATSAEEVVDTIKQALIEAQVAYCEALAPLRKSDIRELQSYLVPVLTTQNHVGHTVVDRGRGRRLCDLMEKMDREALYRTAEALAPLADVQRLELLKSLPADGNVNVPGVTGPVAARIDTPGGAIVIGGKGSNTYQLDKLRDVAVVIDLGGNDSYQEGSVGTDRPVLIVMDLAGNDVYRGKKPGIQGSAVVGISMLLDLAGDDVYHARDVAQGSTLGGVGILIDYAGNDRYAGIRRVQGTAVGGLGVLIDHDGKDDYRGAMWAQGVGGPIGFGMLDDIAGNDHFYCGGTWRNSYYPETPGYEGWGQGVGGGIRQSASGGIGTILDGGGDDVYEFDYLSHGGGYWCGLGFARDFGGNDQRLITRKAYTGGARTERSFQRFGCGWGCHYAMGFLFDDAGNDVYEGTIMGAGMAWDCSIGVLSDFGGNDQYKATGGLTQGTGAQMGLGVLFDYNGEDVYKGRGQGYAPGGISYHDLPHCGGNFSFVVDYGGKDRYGCGARNSGYIQRGDRGGFLIDRPAHNEPEPTATKPPASNTAGS